MSIDHHRDGDNNRGNICNCIFHYFFCYSFVFNFFLLRVLDLNQCKPYTGLRAYETDEMDRTSRTRYFIYNKGNISLFIFLTFRENI